MADVVTVLRDPARTPLEECRRAVAGSWDWEAFVVEDGLTVADRLQVAASLMME